MSPLPRWHQRSLTLTDTRLKFVGNIQDLSEIVEWTGFAAASQSPAALAFSVYVCSNLVPRALDHHAWYKATFGDEYPKKRHAIIPFLL